MILRRGPAVDIKMKENERKESDGGSPTAAPRPERSTAATWITRVARDSVVGYLSLAPDQGEIASEPVAGLATAPLGVPAVRFRRAPFGPVRSSRAAPESKRER